MPAPKATKASSRPFRPSRFNWNSFRRADVASRRNEVNLGTRSAVFVTPIIAPVRFAFFAHWRQGERLMQGSVPQRLVGLWEKTSLDHAQYILSWLKVLKADKRAIFTAASKAQKAADFIIRQADPRRRWQHERALSDIHSGREHAA